MIKKCVICLVCVIIVGLFIYNTCINDSTTISIVGDILLARGVGKEIDKNGFDYPYEKTKSILTSDDITIGNLECTITSGEEHAIKKPTIVFKSDEENARALKEAGFDVLSLGNNHTMDYLSYGLKDTMENLQKNNIGYTGARENSYSDIEPYIIKKKGKKIGILGYNTLPIEGEFFSEDGVRVTLLPVFVTVSTVTVPWVGFVIVVLYVFLLNHM